MVWVFAQMHRNAILSRVTDTKENELGFDFYLRAASFGALAMLTWLASQFPDVAATVYRFIAPRDGVEVKNRATSIWPQPASSGRIYRLNNMHAVQFERTLPEPKHSQNDSLGDEWLAQSWCRKYVSRRMTAAIGREQAESPLISIAIPTLS